MDPLLAHAAVLVIGAQDPATQATSIAALCTALGGVVALFIGWAKWSREQGAKERADAVALAQASNEATVAGLKETVRYFQDLVVNLQGTTGELKGQLLECKTERHAMADTIAEQHTQIMDLQREVRDLQTVNNDRT